jgi:hypothetical protein
VDVLFGAAFLLPRQAFFHPLWLNDMRKLLRNRHFFLRLGLYYRPGPPRRGDFSK